MGMKEFWSTVINLLTSWYYRIPGIWKSAYLLICTWYFLNYSVSAFFQWKLYEAYDYDVFWNTLYSYELLCLAIIVILLYARSLWNISPYLQILGHFIGLVIFTLVMETVFFYFDMYLDGFTDLEDYQQYMIDLLSWDAMRFYDQYIITVAVFYVIRYFDSLQNKIYERNDLLIKNKEMQLSLLKSQINPHFLFNTLNSISTLVGSDKNKARKVISQLSDVFRYALDSYSGYTVKLSAEIEFIESYIKIQQVRFEERLIFEKDIAQSLLQLEIPPMILQPLVENAVKYGIAPKEDGGTIKLSVRPYKNGIFFEVSDNGLGINAKKELDSVESTGIGLKNTDERLKSFFGPTAGLKVEASESGYIVSFILPEKYKGKIENKMELYHIES